MESYHKFHWCVYVYLRKSFRTISLDVYDANFRYSIKYYLISILMTFGLSNCIYTIFYSEKHSVFFSIVVFFVVFLIFLKFLFVCDLQLLIEIVNFIDDIYAKNWRVLGNRDICKKYANVTEKIVKTTSMAYGGCASFSNSLPILMYLTMGTRITPSGNLIPGVDQTTITGYIFSVSIDYLLAGCFYFIAISFDGLCFTIFSNMPLVATVITNYVSEWKGALEARTVSVVSSKHILVNILWMQKKYYENVNKLDRSFFKICTFQTAFSSIYLIIGIYIAITEVHVHACICVVLGLVQITTYCILGTIIETSNEMIYESLNTFEWYLLPSSQRISYKFTLQYTQKSHDLSIAGLWRLNMVTCVSILKTIHSYAMILNNAIRIA